VKHAQGNKCYPDRSDHEKLMLVQAVELSVNPICRLKAFNAEIALLETVNK